MAKMTQTQMVEKLMSLAIGDKVAKDGKVFEVVGLTVDSKMKSCRTDIGLLEEGKPESYMVEGKYLAAGKMLEMSNIRRFTWYAQSPYMNWEKIA